jgi:protein gp37
MERIIEMVGQLNVDAGLRDLLRPLTPEERSGLESLIIQDGGANNPILVWKDKSVIVDGHNRYEICQRLELPFSVVEIEFGSRGDAMQYIVDRQRGQRNPTSEELALAMAKVHEARAMTKAEAIGTRWANDTSTDSVLVTKPHDRKTAAKVAEDFGVSHRTVEDNAKLLRDIRTIEANGTPDVEKKFLAGKFTKQSINAAAAIVKDPGKAANPELASKAAEVIQPRIALPTSEPTKVNPAKSDSITLDAWENLTPDQQQEALSRNDLSGFNSQDNDSIEWALWSWNPITGCQHNCPYCYARDIAERFAGSAAFPDGFKPALRPGRLAAPQHQKFPEEKAKEWMGHKNVFTGSMADIFGKWVPSEWIEAVLASIRKSPQWNFLMLTKFPSRMSEFNLPDNVWAGTSVDCQARVANAEKAFAKVKAKVKWLSIEPMIEPLKFKKLEVFNWVVIGGASKSNETPAWSPPREWVDQLESQCQGLDIPYYEKSNLFTNTARRRGYPGQAVYWTDEIKAPDALCYLPPKEQFVG